MYNFNKTYILKDEKQWYPTRDPVRLTSIAHEYDLESNDVKFKISKLNGENFEFTMDRTNCDKIVHEYIALSFLGGYSDQRIDSVFPELKNKEHSNRTPDLIIPDLNSTGEIMIFELGTQITGPPKSTYDDKMKKYHKTCQIIRETLTAIVHLVVLSISSQGVCSNYNFKDSEIRNLLDLRFQGQQLMDYVLENAIILVKKDEVKEKLKEKFEKISKASFIKDYQENHNKTTDCGSEFETFVNKEYDDSIAWKAYKASFTKGRRRLAKDVIADPMVDSSEMINSFWAEVDQIEEKFGTRKTFKATSIMPWLEMKFKPSKPYSASYLMNGTSQFLEVHSKISDEEVHPIATIWKKALVESISFDDDLGFSMHEPTEDSTKWVKDLTKKRSSFHRAKIELNENEAFYLAKNGVNGLSYWNKGSQQFRDLLLERKDQQKEVIDKSSDLRDIDEFLLNRIKPSDFSLFTPCQLMIDPLIRMASPDESDHKLSDDFYKMVRSTNYSNVFYLWERIIIEANISHNQLTKCGQFVLKQIDNLPVFLLCSSSGPNAHVHFSILVDKTFFSEFKKPFQQPDFENADLAIFDFVSLNRDKLSHFLGLSSRLWTFLAAWMELYNKDLSKPFSCFDTINDVVKMFNVSLLIFMEAKGRTSTSLMQVRHAYQEVSKAGVVKPRPLKCLKKINKSMRTRLQLWFVKKIIKTFLQMTENNPQMNLPLEVSETVDIDEDEEDKDYIDMAEVSAGMFQKFSAQNNSTVTFSKMINFVTETEVERFDIVLNLMYLSHIHNKDDGPGGQSDFKILEKITAQEVITPVWCSAEDLVWKSKIHETEDFSVMYSDHDFNLPLAKLAGKALKRHLETKFPDPIKFLEAKFLNAIDRKSFEEFATYKSSAILPTDPTLKEIETVEQLDKLLKDREKREAKFGSRVKVMENIANLAADINPETSNPFDYLENILSDLKNQGGTYSAVFRKAQIGGDREILIKDIRSRIAINFLETFSRITGEECDNEMLTKGSMKTVRTTEHLNKISKFFKNKDFHLITSMKSGDSETWCQKFVMPVFAAVLKEICPDYLYKIFVFILNLQANKMLQAPTSVLKQYLLHMNRTVTEEGMRKFKMCFLGKENHSIIEERGTILKILTGMEQGILHYTSSLVHCAVKALLKEQEIKLMKTVNLKYFPERKMRFFKTDKQSSDDFSDIRSLAIQKITEEINEKEAEQILIEKCSKVLVMLEYAQESFVNYFTIKESREKSTPSAFNYLEEFNSLWFLSNTLLSPIIKFVYAAGMLKPLSGMYQKQEVLSNLRKQLLESGCTLSLTSIIQMCQLYCHYQTLGWLSNRYHFQEYSELLQQTPAVAYGFFLLDHQNINSLFGFDFTRYRMIKHSAIFSQVEKSFYMRNGFEFDENGMSTVRTFLLLGQNKKYNSFRTKLHSKMEGDWFKFFTENPEVLFRKSISYDESKMKILRKCDSPASAEAFTYLTSNKLYSTSAYVLNFPCFSTKVRTVSEDGSTVVNVTKQSIIGALRNLVPVDFFSENELKVVFPTKEFYDEILNVIETMKPSGFGERIRKYSPPMKYVIMRAPSSADMALVSFQDVCKYLWFPNLYKSKRSDTDLRDSLKFWKDEFPWLHESLEDTLKDSNCPFENIISLYDFASSLTSKPKSYRILSYAQKKSSFITTLKNIIKHSFKRNCMLSLNFEETLEKGISLSLPRIASEIVVLTSLYKTQAWKEAKLTKFLSELSMKLKLTEAINLKQIKNLSEKMKDLALIMVYCEMKEKGFDNQKMKKFMKMLSDLKTTYSEFYQVPQKYDPASEKWGGRGVIKFRNGSLIGELIIFDDKIVKINVNDIKLLQMNLKGLQKRWSMFTFEKLILKKRAQSVLLNGVLYKQGGFIGTPIELMENLKFEIPKAAFEKFRLDVQGKILRLVYQDRKNIKIVSFRPWNNLDFKTSTEVLKVTNEVEDVKLISNKEMTIDELWNFLGKIEENSELLRTDESDKNRILDFKFREEIRTTFLIRLNDICERHGKKKPIVLNSQHDLQLPLEEALTEYDLSNYKDQMLDAGVFDFFDEDFDTLLGSDEEFDEENFEIDELTGFESIDAEIIDSLTMVSSRFLESESNLVFGKKKDLEAWKENKFFDLALRGGTFGGLHFHFRIAMAMIDDGGLEYFKKEIAQEIETLFPWSDIDKVMKNIEILSWIMLKPMKPLSSHTLKVLREISEEMKSEMEGF